MLLKIVQAVFYLVVIQVGCQRNNTENPLPGRQQSSEKPRTIEKLKRAISAAPGKVRPATPDNSLSDRTARPVFQPAEKTDFHISGWIPRWRKSQGVESAISNISLFKSLSPFAYRVDSQGEITDTLKVDKGPFSKLIQTARTRRVKILRTFVWNRSRELRKQLSSTQGLRQLVVMPDAKSIKPRTDLAKQHGLGGIVLFKIDGLEDPAMWEMLEAAVKPKSECR